MFTPTEKDGITYYSILLQEDYDPRRLTDTSVEVFVVSKSHKVVGYRYKFNSRHNILVVGSMYDYVDRVYQSMIKTLSKELIKESLLDFVPTNVEDLYYNQSENLVDWLPTLETVTDSEGNNKVRVKI